MSGDPWADFNGGNQLRRYHSTDGTLVYEVGFTTKDGWETRFWNVAMTPEQAYRVRDALTRLEHDKDLIAWWKCEVRTVYVDDLAELGDALRELMEVKDGNENEAGEVGAKPGRGRVREPEAGRAARADERN
jgi:hypothetical protein